MNENGIFTFTASNGTEVTGVVVDVVAYKEEDPWDGSYYDKYLCYAQNRLFYYSYLYGHSKAFIGDDGYESFYEEKDLDEWVVGKTLVDYAILPEYDAIIEEYERNLVMEQASTLQPWEEEFEREIQGCNDK